MELIVVFLILGAIFVYVRIKQRPNVEDWEKETRDNIVWRRRNKW